MNEEGGERGGGLKTEKVDASGEGGGSGIR